MNALVFLRSIGLKIFWKLIAVGLYGDGGTPAELARQEVLDFLNLCLTQEGPQTDRIVSILCEGNDYEAMDAKIKGFAALDGSDLSLQKRKWRAYRLTRLLETLSADPLQGLLALMEFWLPARDADCPLTFPCKDGSPSVEDYFTRSNYNAMVQRNRAWLSEEISEIQRAEQSLRGCL